MTNENGNTGEWNAGDWNAGDRNAGNRNAGNWNAGNWNTGDCNAGNWNTGDCNTGNWNAGDWNTGDRNAGNRNAGDWNTGDWNTGYFNCDTPKKIRCFGKMVSLKKWNAAHKPYWLYAPQPTLWVRSEEMTDQEREGNPEHETTGGYLRENDMREQWRMAFESASDDDVQAVRDLPGFDADVFEKITGLRI